jgi:pseudaminic acid synthase
MDITINNRIIGSNHRVYIVAEMSANHNQNFEQAVKIVEAAKEAGADAIKLQTYTPDTLTIDSDREYFQIGKGSTWQGRKLYDLYGDAYTPWEWQPRLKEIANYLGLDLFSTPFDHSAIEFLEEMDLPAYKIASFEIVDFTLIQRIAQTGKPIIMSTGMATLAEIDEAIRIIREAGGDQLALMKCTSTYPALPEEMNLRTIPHLAETFGVPVGLSDHTLGIAVAVAAVTLGACIVEKHLTISRSEPGPELALGEVRYEITEGEKASRVFRRSLFVVKDIKKGERFSEENVRSIRPGHGIHTRYMERVLGKTATRDIKKGTPLEWSLIK